MRQILSPCNCNTELRLLLYSASSKLTSNFLLLFVGYQFSVGFGSVIHHCFVSAFAIVALVTVCIFMSMLSFFTRSQQKFSTKCLCSLKKAIMDVRGNMKLYYIYKHLSAIDLGTILDFIQTENSRNECIIRSCCEKNSGEKNVCA